jgi:hypothetical protein
MHVRSYTHTLHTTHHLHRHFQTWLPSAAWTPDGFLYCIAEKCTLRLAQVSSKAEAWCGDINAHSRKVAFTDDGMQMAVLTESGRELLLFATRWEAEEKGLQLLEKFELPHEATWWVAMFSPDGQYFAAKGSYPDYQKEQYIEIFSFKRTKKGEDTKGKDAGAVGGGGGSSDGGVGGFDFRVDTAAAIKQRVVVDRTARRGGSCGGRREGWEEDGLYTYELVVERPAGASGGGIKSDPGCGFAFLHHAKHIVVGKDSGAVELYDIAVYRIPYSSCPPLLQEPWSCTT